MSVGAYAARAHSAIDELVARAGTAVVCGGTGLYLRAALAELEVPPPPRPGVRERIDAEVQRDPQAAYDRLLRLDPRAATAIHVNDHRRVVRALELADAGESLVPAEDRLWASSTRHSTLIVGPRRARGGARTAHRRAHERDVRQGRRRGSAGSAPRGRLPNGCEGPRSRRDRDAARTGGTRTGRRSAPAATRRISENGCDGSPASLAWTAH